MWLWSRITATKSQSHTEDVPFQLLPTTKEENRGRAGLMVGMWPCANVYSVWISLAKGGCFHTEESGLVLSWRAEAQQLCWWSRTRLLCSFYELVRSGGASLYMTRPEKKGFHFKGPLTISMIKAAFHKMGKSKVSKGDHRNQLVSLASNLIKHVNEFSLTIFRPFCAKISNIHQNNSFHFKMMNMNLTKFYFFSLNIVVLGFIINFTL